MGKHGFRALAAVGLLALTASGCWLQIGGNPAGTDLNDHETGLTADNVGSLHQLWTLHETPVTRSEAIVNGGRLFTTNTTFDYATHQVASQSVQASDSGTSQKLWEHVLATGPNASAQSVVYIGDALWVTYHDDSMPACSNELARLDPATGAVLTTDTVGNVTSDLVADGGVIAYLGSEGGCPGQAGLVVRDAATRAVLWTYAFPAGETPVLPVIAGGNVYVNTGTHMYAFAAKGCGAATCAPLWAHAPDVGWFRDRPEVADGRVFVWHVVPATSTPFEHNVQALSVVDGALVWQTAVEDGSVQNLVHGFAVAYGNVYVLRSFDELTGDDGYVAVYPTAGCPSGTCTPAWKALSTERFDYDTRPTVGGNVVYVEKRAGGAPDGGSVIAIDARGCGHPTCGQLARVKPLNGAASGPMSLASGRLYVSTGNDVYAFGP